MTTSKQSVLDKAINDIQNDIMNAWKTVMKYEEQMRNISMYESDEAILLLLIDNEKSKIETLSAILDKLEPPKPDADDVQAAIEVLRSNGYQVDAMWHIRDVIDKYECDENTAEYILNEVLDRSFERINNDIHDMAINEHELKEKYNDL
jgi:hypothetical protein